jgi:GNAT superfamily N-acetyltransferase
MHRLATPADLPAIQGIERAAGEIFRTVGMNDVADDGPIDSRDFCRFVTDQRAWVDVDSDGSPVAYLLLIPLEASAHIEQITVHPRASRQGIGARLLAVVDDWASRHNVARLTLTTFRDVPWNAPYYARLGFTVLDPADWTPAISATVDNESAAGLSRWPRVVMVRAVDPCLMQQRV